MASTRKPINNHSFAFIFAHVPFPSPSEFCHTLSHIVEVPSTSCLLSNSAHSPATGVCGAHGSSEFLLSIERANQRSRAAAAEPACSSPTIPDSCLLHSAGPFGAHPLRGPRSCANLTTAGERRWEERTPRPGDHRECSTKMEKGGPHSGSDENSSLSGYRCNEKDAGRCETLTKPD